MRNLPTIRRTPPAPGRHRPLARLLCTSVLLGFCGCGSPDPPAPSDREIWEVFYIQGSRVGYAQTTVRHETREGQPVVRIQGFAHAVLKRWEEDIMVESRFTSIETPDGRLLEFQSEIPQGETPMRTKGLVRGDALKLEVTTRGKTLEISIPWKDNDGGPLVVARSLWQEPMQPHQRRTVRGLDVQCNQVATTTLSAWDYEQIQLPGGPQELLRIETATTVANQTLKGTIWTNRSGDVLRNRLEVMQLETVRSTKAEALKKPEESKFDLFSDTAIHVDRWLARPHDTRRIRYRVRLERGNPAKVFVSGSSQRVESTGPDTAVITVYAIRPDRPGGNSERTADPPSDADRKPNNQIQSDDPNVLAMAREAVDDGKAPWQTALALERYVNEVMTEDDLSTVFATAAEVAKNRTGDCTEHAVLLAALARAHKIPARVAIGLVYVRQTFAYHMWTEVYIRDRWIPLDAMLAQGGIGAAHIKVAHSNLQGASPAGSFLPVLQLIGRLEIEIEEVESKGEG